MTARATRKKIPPFHIPPEEDAPEEEKGEEWKQNNQFSTHEHIIEKDHMTGLETGKEYEQYKSSQQNGRIAEWKIRTINTARKQNQASQENATRNIHPR